MERQTVVMGVSLAVLLSLGGFYVGFLSDSDPVQRPGETGFPIETNITVDSDNNVEEAKFDNRSLDLMAENTDEARFYLDYNQDGSFDREIDIQSDNTLRNTSELIELDNSSYRLYLQYRDDPSVNDDAFMTLFRIDKP